MEYNKPNTLASLLNKDEVRYVTQEITPEEVQYVADVKCVYDECAEKGCTEEQSEDILYVTKIIAFADKFRVLHWAAVNMSFHKTIDDFYSEIEDYKDAIAENIQGVVGQFRGCEFTDIKLPLSDNPLEIINELKICVQNWMKLHEDDIEYEGCRNATSTFLETIYKYVYLFRLCKQD